MSAALTVQTRYHDFIVTTLKYHTRYMCYVCVARSYCVSFNLHSLYVHTLHRTAVTSLQSAGGIYGLIALIKPKCRNIRWGTFYEPCAHTRGGAGDTS